MPERAKQIQRIREEETLLGSAQRWTHEEAERLARIRRMRHRLPKADRPPIRKSLDPLFFHTKRNSK